jgi:hypothetical protein
VVVPAAYSLVETGDLLALVRQLLPRRARVGGDG